MTEVDLGEPPEAIFSWAFGTTLVMTVAATPHGGRSE